MTEETGNVTQPDGSANKSWWLTWLSVTAKGTLGVTVGMIVFWVIGLGLIWLLGLIGVEFEFRFGSTARTAFGMMAGIGVFWGFVAGSTDGMLRTFRLSIVKRTVLAIFLGAIHGAIVGWLFQLTPIVDTESGSTTGFIICAGVLGAVFGAFAQNIMGQLEVK
jgi:hypothetical protein